MTIKNWKTAVLFMCLSGYCLAGPVGPKRNMPIVQQRNEAEMEPETNANPHKMTIMSSLSLPSNATSIRADITDGFSCENRTYGYYADVENDCQIFHVCLPVTYADGKENIFRWSFICPEDTIFSQDSFTCMRPDDMIISCAESYQYYELNRVFGMSESAADTENNNEHVSETVLSAATLEAETEFAAARPVIQEEKEKVIGQSKPLNAQKPARRKPSTSYATQKHPSNSYPLRKIAQAPKQKPEEPTLQVNENIKPTIEQEQETKPYVQKFSRRPVPIMAHTSKDKIQNSKTESVTATRTELFNQMRKRPTMFNRKPAEQIEKETQEEQVKTELGQKQTTFSALESHLPISNTETQATDSEIQASESNHVFVKPEKAAESTQNIENNSDAPEEPIKVLEAFEEIPALISEVVESPQAGEEENKNEETLPVVNIADHEKSNVADEPQIIEEVQSTEEMQNVLELHKLTETSPGAEIQESITADEIKKDEEMQPPEEVLNEELQTADKTEAAQESETKVQQSLRTSAEETQNVTEEVVQEIQGQVAKETPTYTEIQEAIESQIPLEKTQTAEAAEFTMEHQMEEAAAVSTETEVSAAILDTKEEILNSEKIQEAEESPVIENQIAERQQDTEKDEDVDDSQIAETAQSEEINHEVKVALIDEEVQNVEESKENMETAETPTETILALQEPQPQLHNIKEPQTLEKVESVQDSKPVEETGETQVSAMKDSELLHAENVKEPSIFEEISEEHLNIAPVQTIEQMESERPAEAPESMQATEEMSHPNAIVQQMYEDMDMSKQSVGGFKPVDPVMAHEAEQLIVDFINTLRKNDFTNETPGMHRTQINAENPEQDPFHNNIAEVQEAGAIETNEEHLEEDGKIEEQDFNDEIQAEMSETQTDNVKDNGEEVKDNQEAEESKEINKIDDLNPVESEVPRHTPAGAMNLPQEMYQIPVQVITAPIEELPTDAEPAEINANIVAKVQDESPAKPMDGYPPMSIDDIVELVKERLDQMPKNEMETPMQLEQVLGEAAAGEVKEYQSSTAAEVQQPTSHSEEEIVMPIYQRTGPPVHVDAAAQTEDLQQVLNAEQSQVSDDVTDFKEKTKRSYRSRAMLAPKLDPRKRHFLFKTDSS